MHIGVRHLGGVVISSVSSCLRLAVRICGRIDPRIQGLASGRETVNGLPARVTVFDARTDGGVIRGMLAHIGFGGRTYQLAAYSAPENFGAYQRQFERVISSFGPVTDRSVLEVQPNRMDVVRISRTMSLEEFTRVHRSAVPTRELAILNQVPGADSTLPAGTLVKRVVG